jgi:DNA repair exonuclease SbcCD ATPase subunit
VFQGETHAVAKSRLVDAFGIFNEAPELLKCQEFSVRTETTVEIFSDFLRFVREGEMPEIDATSAAALAQLAAEFDCEPIAAAVVRFQEKQTAENSRVGERVMQLEEELAAARRQNAMIAHGNARLAKEQERLVADVGKIRGELFAKFEKLQQRHQTEIAELQSQVTRLTGEKLKLETQLQELRKRTGGNEDIADLKAALEEGRRELRAVRGDGD